MIALPDFFWEVSPSKASSAVGNGWILDFGETSDDTVKMATGNRTVHQLRLVVVFSPILFGWFYTSQVVQDVFHQQ